MQNRTELDRAYRLHGPTVFRRARQILGNEADAVEVVQDVFLSLFERPEQYAGKSELTTFLYSVTTHACLSRLRNQRNRARLRKERLEDDATLETRAPLSPEQLLVLRRSLAVMPVELCQAAILHLMDGLSHHEISEIMNCSRRHVGDLLERVSQWGSVEETVPC